jgi:hypothetical protein
VRRSVVFVFLREVTLVFERAAGSGRAIVLASLSESFLCIAKIEAVILFKMT